MAKFLIAGGFLVMIVGCVAAAGLYALQLSQAFNTTMDTAVNSDAAAAKYCTEGEKLVTNKGPSQYQPGQGYASSVTYFCEDAKGNRRDVTDKFAESLVGGVGQLFSSAFAIRWEFVCLSGLGVLTMAAGIVLALRRRQTPAPVPPAPPSSGPMFFQ